MPSVFYIHFAATAYMAGIIWFVQRIHYPWFHEVPPDKFMDYHRRYTERMGWLVGPVMLVELITGVWWIWMQTNTATILNATGLAVLWISTFSVQVPCHNRLSAGYDADVHHRLVRSNWVRTVVWSGRLIVLIAAAITA